jgi:hypothetical protein
MKHEEKLRKENEMTENKLQMSQVKAARQPPSAVEELRTDMIEGGRIDWGYIHECKSLKPSEPLIFSFL